ncbi:transposase, IS605 OrfB family protein [Calothrix parasitica NIES-267]|uniref:Transposase, IS605 OrfB family protein n=1 Tax=Calothrix parasitica NIES-267 TaxID=1973488 RepID=A0A1Z4LNR3_9CYAN|nr:transposase, IS605 OrfB family protein [Calothrix parasitica NIES-267]
MLLGYRYKLKPNREQTLKVLSWIDMLRANYNYNLADREATYQARFVQGEYCNLRNKSAACPLSCPISSNSATSDTGEVYKVKNKTGEIKLKTAEEIQITNLPVLKKTRPWYKGIDSTVLQQNVKRLQIAYNNFFAGRGKYPKFKNKSNFKSLTFTAGIKLTDKVVYLPKLGWVGYFNSRSIPEGFKIKSATVRLKADGLYITLKIEDKAVPAFPVISAEEVKTVAGLDMGITQLAHCSDGSQYNNPKHSTNKRTRKLLKIRQRSLSRKKKRSNNRKKARVKVSRLHQKITHRREAFQWKLARELTKKADAIIVEDLNISAMKKRCSTKEDSNRKGRFLPNGQSKKRGLNRSISDASWYSLTQKIEYLAAKQGKVFERVNPKFTSQICSSCGHKDKASRSQEKFICTNCGYHADADINAARNIKKRGIEIHSFPVSCKIKIKMVPEDFREPRQLRLFEMPTAESTEGKRRRAAPRVPLKVFFEEKTFKGARESKRRVPGNSARQLTLFEDIPVNLV